MLGFYIYSFVLYSSEDDTLVPKHVGVLILVTNCTLLSAFISGSIDISHSNLVRLISAYIHARKFSLLLYTELWITG